MKNLVAYLSHPIGDLDDDPIGRQDNLRNAGEWLQFVVEQTDLAILCPWLAYITHLSGIASGPRALVDQLRLVPRCDILLQTGGRMSPHMKYEQTTADREGMPIINLLMFGARPPLEESKRVGIATFIKAERARLGTLKPRRVWLPPLTVEDIASLRYAEQRLIRDHASQDAIDMIQKIVRAALKP